MDEVLWQTAIEQAGLGQAEQAALREACEGDPDFGEQLAYVFPHLALDLSGDFLRSLIRKLERSRESAIMNALVETIGLPGRELRARLAELAEGEAEAE